MSKTILITGATDGIGKQTALELALQNSNEIIIHGRNEEKCKETIAELIEKTGNEKIKGTAADFSSLNDVAEMSDNIKENFDKIDALINNAGVYMNEKVLTADGYETTFAVNHLAPFLLTNKLIEKKMIPQGGRIINVSSIAHTRASVDFENLNGEIKYDAYGAYAISKLANVLFTNKLSQMLLKDKITANSLHPGVITTKLLRTGFNVTGASLETGAATSVYLAASEEVAGVTGRYFVNKKIEDTSSLAADEELIDKFWELSMRFVNKQM